MFVEQIHTRKILEKKTSLQTDLELNSGLIATNFNSICCENKEKMVKNALYLYPREYNFYNFAMLHYSTQTVNKSINLILIIQIFKVKDVELNLRHNGTGSC